MGIKNLSSIIKEHAPDAIKEGEIKNHFGRKVAIVSFGFFYPVSLLPGGDPSLSCFRPIHAGRGDHSSP